MGFVIQCALQCADVILSQRFILFHPWSSFHPKTSSLSVREVEQQRVNLW
jgi:hypothetical protein